jgi:hypothetical protein
MNKNLKIIKLMTRNFIQENTQGIVLTNLGDHWEMIDASGLMEKISDVPFPGIYRSRSNIAVLKAQYKEINKETEMTIEGLINLMGHFEKGEYVGKQGAEAGKGRSGLQWDD